MSEFSNYISRFVEAEQVRVSELARFCGVDRGTTYKYLNGGRLPATEDVVIKIGEYLRLSPMEMKQLKEAYEIDRIGKETYFSRKNVRDFLIHFPEMKWEETPVSWNETYEEKEDSCIETIQDKKEWRHILCKMLLKEQKQAKPMIRLQMQPKSSFLYDFLISQAQLFSNMRMEQIICVDHDGKDSKKGVENLESLKQIIMMHVAMLDYQSFYYYDSADSHFHNLNILPCMILTTEEVLLFHPDEKEGIWMRDPSVVSMLKNRFDANKILCSPFLHAITDGFAEYEKLTEIIYEKDCHSIQADPCIMPYLTPDMVQNYVSDPSWLKGCEGILQSYGKAWESKETIFVFMTVSGLKYFMDTGMNLEIPAFLQVRFTKEDRLNILRKMVHTPRFITYLLKEPLDAIPLNMHWYITKEAGCFLFYNRKQEQVYMILKESGLLEMFRDYMESLDSTAYYNEEESHIQLEAVLAEYEKRWKE